MVEGVDETQPALDQRKRKAADGDEVSTASTTSFEHPQ